MNNEIRYYFLHIMGLTVNEATIAETLFFTKAHCSRNKLQEAIDPTNKSQFSKYGAKRNVDSHIKRMRHKFTRHGLVIQTLHGLGYTFPDETRVKIRAHISLLPKKPVVAEAFKLEYGTFGFSKSQTDMMNMLLCAKSVCSREEFLDRTGRGDVADRSIDSAIKIMRFKLGEAKIQITTYYGLGYFLTDENKLKIMNWDNENSPTTPTPRQTQRTPEQARM